MQFLVSAKDSDLRKWRPVTEFAATYRQALLDQTARCTGEEAVSLLGDRIALLERMADEHESDQAQLETALNELAACRTIDLMKRKLRECYTIIYRQIDRFRSAPAFYSAGMRILEQLCTGLFGMVLDRLNLRAGDLPPVALIALGPAGRHEYSPWCPLQLMLAHGDATPAQQKTILLAGSMLHEGLEQVGLWVDPVVTTRNPDWCAGLDYWRHRCVTVLENGEPEELIDLLRLSDQTVLYCNGGTGEELRTFSQSLLHESHPALTNLVERMYALTNGLGLLGNLKLEKSGVERGHFSLLDHGLLPLSAAVSALSLFRGVRCADTPQRIRELLAKSGINVDMAERMLQTWHTLHEFRLLREQALGIDNHTREALYLDPAELDDSRIDALREALESVRLIQRHVYVLFHAAEE